jgi:hypothetical protein
MFQPLGVIISGQADAKYLSHRPATQAPVWKRTPVVQPIVMLVGSFTRSLSQSPEDELMMN